MGRKFQCRGALVTKPDGSELMLRSDKACPICGRMMPAIWRYEINEQGEQIAPEVLVDICPDCSYQEIRLGEEE